MRTNPASCQTSLLLLIPRRQLVTSYCTALNETCPITGCNSEPAIQDLSHTSGKLSEALTQSSRLEPQASLSADYVHDGQSIQLDVH